MKPQHWSQGCRSEAQSPAGLGQRRGGIQAPRIGLGSHSAAAAWQNQKGPGLAPPADARTATGLSDGDQRSGGQGLGVGFDTRIQGKGL